MSDPASKEWEELRRQARSLENEIDSKLLLLSKCDVGDEEENEDEDDVTRDKVPLLQSDSNAGLCGRLSREIESLLSRLMEVNNRMSAVADNSRSSSTTYTLQRHRDILNDYAKEFRKTKSNFEVNMDREKLFQTSSTKGETVIPMSNSQSTSLLSREAESARNSEILVDEQIDTVLRTRETLMNQKAALKAIHSQMTTLANRFPMINSLIQRINIKKRKDTIILASVIGVCLFILIIYNF